MLTHNGGVVGSTTHLITLQLERVETTIRLIHIEDGHIIGLISPLPSEVHAGFTHTGNSFPDCLLGILVRHIPEINVPLIGGFGELTFGQAIERVVHIRSHGNVGCIKQTCISTILNNQ